MVLKTMESQFKVPSFLRPRSSMVHFSFKGCVYMYKESKKEYIGDRTEILPGLETPIAGHVNNV
jgi:hypothetical protein